MQFCVRLSSHCTLSLSLSRTCQKVDSSEIDFCDVCDKAVKTRTRDIMSGKSDLQVKLDISG